MKEIRDEMNKYKTILEDLKFDKHTYNYIYEKKNKNETYLDEETRIILEKNLFIIEKFNGYEFHLFFNKPKMVIYSNIGKTQSLIFSTLQIDEFMKKNFIQELEFQIDNYKGPLYYTKNKVYLKYIDGDEFKFQAITFIEKKIELNNNVFLESNKFSPLDLSEYFYEYFEYNNPKDEKEFIYYDTPKRKELMEMLRNFYYSYFNFFKFCGPISGGKSTTLLKFKNEFKGVIYFNLKTIKKYYLKGNSKYKSIMSYELKRIRIEEKNKKDTVEKLNDIMKNNQVLETIFIKIIEILVSLNIRNILVIDQFKNAHFENTTFKEIKEKIINTPVGLILSSSIDEKEIKIELEATLRKYNTMPKLITPENQHNYFYISDLLKNEVIKEIYSSKKEINKNFLDLYEQFSFKRKYISIFEKCENPDDGIKEINEIITNKMKSQSFFPDSITLEFIFLSINNCVDQKFEYKEENFNTLKKVPLKFIDINFENDNFSLCYGFPFIKTLVKNMKTKLDINSYFEKKIYLDKFYSNFKGDYFENAVNNAIKEKKIFFKENSNDEEIHELTVYNILNLKENDNEENAYTIVNRIKNNNENNSYIEIDYKDYINEKMTKIKEKLSIIKDSKIIIFDYLRNMLNEELNNLKKEKEIIDQAIKEKNKIPKKYRENINVQLYNDKFKDGNILIKQTQKNGRCLDSAFLYGDKNNKTLICLQMKFYEKTTTVSSSDKNKLNKPYIKSLCQKVLSNIYLNLGITVASWHYILILHFEEETKVFNTNFVKICNDYDLEYIFYDPNKKKFYNREKEEIQNISLNYLTNLDNDENESNPINCFQESLLANSLLKKRNRDLEDKKSPEALAQNMAKDFESKYQISFHDFFSKIKKKYKNIKNIKIILSLTMDMNKYFPSLKDGYGFIFLNDAKDGLIFEGKTKDNDNYITLNSKNDDKIVPLKIYSSINLEEEFIYFIVKLN